MVLFFIFISGLSIGSFLNVLADRWSFEESISGRSHCDHCKKTLSWLDLIPLASWILLRGRCRYCRKKISVYYPIAELVTGLSFVFVWFHEIPRLDFVSLGMTISLLGIASSLIVIFFADIKYHIIPDEAVVALMIFSAPLVFLSGRIPDHIIGALVLSLIMYGLFAVTKGKGMGFGDVKYAVAMGFLLGLVPGLMGLYIAFILGAIVSVILIIGRKRGMKSKIAFGPFLIVGTVVMMFWGEQVQRLVQNLF